MLGIMRHIACFVIAQIIFIISLFLCNFVMTLLLGDEGAIGGTSAISFGISFAVAIYGYVRLNRYAKNKRSTSRMEVDK